jgi:hypothetical protein
MGYKDKQKQKEYQQQHYQNNKELWRDRLRQKRKDRQKFLQSLKKGRKCECGEDDVRCLDFHHLNNKLSSLAQAVRNCWSEEKIASEVEKCIVLCANCHLKINLQCQDKEKVEVVGTTKRFRCNRAWLDEYKTSCKCEDCSENDIECLVFHHIGTKKMSISRMIGSGYSVASIIEELKQCICLCAKCHRKRHNGNLWERDSNLKEN